MKKAVAGNLNKPTTPVQKLRIKKGLSQSQMAQLMGINTRSYITLEKSHFLHKREITQIIRLCLILECSISDLIEDETVLADLKFLEYQNRKRNEPDYVPDEDRDSRAKPKKKFNSTTN